MSVSQKVAVVIPARDDRGTVAATVRACHAIPNVDLIIVVDDGSEDDTAQVARTSGAVVVRHSLSRGRSSALETGVKVAAMRDRADWPARHLLFLDPDLGDSAIEVSPLVEAVMLGVADCAIGVPKNVVGGPGLRGVSKTAVKLIRSKTGWKTTDPLSTERCVRRDAVNAVMPFWLGLSVDVGLTVDLVTNGFSVVELPCAFEHIEGPHPREKPRWGKTATVDLWLALQARRFTVWGVPSDHRPDVSSQEMGIPYSVKRVQRT